MIKTSDLIWQDTQHQILFDLIDQIKVEPFDRNILDKLHLYAEHHFILEEAYMTELNYPQTEAHVRAHNRFREELGLLVGTQDDMDSVLREAVSDFLTKWLKLHVFGIDRYFEAFVLESKAK